MATPAHCLVVLRDEANRENPGRDESSDGWIGDTRHHSTGIPENGGSKHNPNRRGVVDARDFDSSGLDVARFVACAIRHPSTRNVIYNRRIRSKGMQGGLVAVYAYHGPSPHTEHVHVDIEMTEAQEDDGRAWGYYRGGAAPVVPVPVVTPAAGGPGGLGRLPSLRKNPGTVSSSVRLMQRALVRIGYLIGRDGRFGPGTDGAVRTFQRRAGLTPDGHVGPKTWTALAQALLVKAGFPLKVDGGFGPATAAAVAGFQRRARIGADSVIGPVTWTKLLTSPAAKP